MEQNIPADVLEGLTESAKKVAEQWWSDLPEADRAAIASLCKSDFHPLDAPKIIGGRFVPKDETTGWPEWFAEYFDHLVAHPELQSREPPRTLHIG